MEITPMAESLRPEVRECSNCGEIAPCVARQDAGQMCHECWRAELVYVQHHLAADEIDPAFWQAIFGAFAAQ